MPDEVVQPGTEATPTTTETGTPASGSEAAPSLLTETLDKPADATEPVKPAGPPETYADWKLPEGFTLDKTAAAEAAPLFKELGLTQEQGQKLVDFYSKNMLASAKSANEAFSTTRKDWVDSLKADPVLGKDLSSGKVTRAVNGALETLQNPKLVADFKEAMDQSGMGDNPAFVRVMYALASKLTEGTYVQGQPTKGNARPTAAAAIFPNLPTGQG
jgi:hypothetical protein